MKKIVGLLLGLVLLFCAKPALAIQFKNGADVTFTKDQKIDETLFVFGNNINFDGSLNGDLYCAGQNISITGSVKGDIICAGQSIKVTGAVDGNIRVISQTVDIDSLVSRNVLTLSQKLALGPKSNIKGDVLFGGQTIDLSGVAGRDLSGLGQNVVVSGSLFRNAVVTVSNMQVTDKAKVGGSLDYYIDQADTLSQVNIATGSVKGSIRKHEIIRPQKTDFKQEAQEKFNKVKPGLEIFGKTVGIISFTLLALVLIYFNRKRTDAIVSIIRNKPVISGLIGLAVLCVTPIALFILCLTIIGLPIALVVFLVYMITLFISSLYATLLMGVLLMEKMYQGKPFSIYLAAFVGCIGVGILSMIPVLGWLLIMVLFLMGLGASFLSFLPER